MGKKLSFTKLTEDLENLNEETVEKSEDKRPEDAIQDVPPAHQEAEFVQPPVTDQKTEDKKAEEAAKDEEGKDEDKAKEDEGKEEPEAEDKEPEAKTEDEPEADEDEEVEKSDKSEKAKEKKKEKVKDNEKKYTDKDEPDGDKEDQAKARAAEKKKEGDKVKKSEETEVVSEQDFIGAFEAVVKSYGSIKTNQDNLGEKIESIEKSISEILSRLPKAEEVTKSEGKKKEDEDKEEDQSAPEEPITAEEIEKSAKEEEAPEGKAVEFVSKSTDGVAVPEAEATGEDAPEEATFNARDHVSEVTNYYMDNAKTMKRGQLAELRGAVNRVKRGDGTESDINLFKEIVDFGKNSEK